MNIKSCIAVLSPLAVANGLVRSWSLSNSWFLRPTWVSPQTASRSVQPFLQSSPVFPTHRHTDHATCDICINRPHLMYCVQAMWPINNSSRRFSGRLDGERSSEPLHYSSM